MTAADTALQAQVDAQLLDQGAFAPLELLFNSGRLLYSDYESWRRREIEFLDTVLMGNSDKIKAEIAQAASYARRIGLVEQQQEFHPWCTEGAPAAGGSDKALRVSMDPQLQRLISSRYIRAQNLPQMDLFFDNPVVALTNGIVLALTTRNLPDTQRQLDQLYTQAPNHADLAAFDQLQAALGRLGHAVENPRQESAFLLEITPTARRLLGAQSRDLLSPLWLQLAAVLKDVAYDDQDPTLHCSFALSQAQDWVGVRDNVLREAGWQEHPALCVRLAESAFQRRQRVEALAAWCQVCWRAPTQAAEAVNKLRQPELTALWQSFLDDEADLSEDGERLQTARTSAQPAPETITEADFPAWLLLKEPGLALQLTEDLPSGNTPAETHFQYVHRWLQARRSRRQSDELALRKTLQARHPALFRLLKRSI